MTVKEVFLRVIHFSYSYNILGPLNFKLTGTITRLPSWQPVWSHIGYQCQSMSIVFVFTIYDGADKNNEKRLALVFNSALNWLTVTVPVFIEFTAWSRASHVTNTLEVLPNLIKFVIVYSCLKCVQHVWSTMLETGLRPNFRIRL